MRNNLKLYAALTILVGGLFWAITDEADWWAYVDDRERGPWPKFKFYWWEQMILSGIFGAILAMPTTLLLIIGRLIYQRIVKNRVVSDHS